MNKQQQEQKKIEDAQRQEAKAFWKKREDKLLKKEFIAREWKAEVDIMEYTLKYNELQPVYQKFREEQDAKQNIVVDEPKALEDADTQEQKSKDTPV